MVMTAELADSYTDLRFSPHGTAFLTDVIILQRYIELKGRLRPGVWAKDITLAMLGSQSPRKTSRSLFLRPW